MEIEIENNDIICDGKRIRDGYRDLKKEAFDKVGKFVIFHGVWERNEEEMEEYIENRLEDFIKEKLTRGEEAFDKVGKFVIFHGVWERNEEEMEEYIENRLEDFIKEKLTRGEYEEEKR